MRTISPQNIWHSQTRWKIGLHQLFMRPKQQAAKRGNSLRVKDHFVSCVGWYRDTVASDTPYIFITAIYSCFHPYFLWVHSCRPLVSTACCQLCRYEVTISHLLSQAFLKINMPTTNSSIYPLLIPQNDDKFPHWKKGAWSKTFTSSRKINEFMAVKPASSEVGRLFLLGPAKAPCPQDWKIGGPTKNSRENVSFTPFSGFLPKVIHGICTT